jgi:NitT/TauT family transport system ATP-binding protein
MKLFSRTDAAPHPTDAVGVAADTPAAVDRPVTVKISAHGVERHFDKGRVHALGPVDLEVRDGEFLCIVGPSGCGKSTFLRMIAGLIRPSAGYLELHTDSRSPVSMVFQDYGIYPWKTVEQNMRFGLDVARVPKREGTALARTWIERMGLSGFEKAYPATLSGGMRQRVSIGRALAVDPEVLLMDEPFAALDAQLRQVLQDELLRVWEADKRTVIFVTHSLEEALLLGDRIVIMTNRPGCIRALIDVPFARPRSGELRADPEFGAMRQQLWDLLRDEVEA